MADEETGPDNESGVLNTARGDSSSDDLLGACQSGVITLDQLQFEVDGVEPFHYPEVPYAQDIDEFMMAHTQASFPSFIHPFQQGFPQHMMMTGVLPHQQSQFPQPSDTGERALALHQGTHPGYHFPTQCDSQQLMMFDYGTGQHPQLPLSKGMAEMELATNHSLLPEHPYQTGMQLHMGNPGKVGKLKVVKIENCRNMNLNLGTGEMSTTPLGNIIDSTKKLIQHYDAASHVSTFAERDAYKKLKHRGCLFIKGRAGTGKTRIGLHIIDDLAREKKRVPIYLTSALDWNLIPKFQPQGEKGKGEKFVVMIDDIFGSSSLVQSALDEWEKMFEFMWPSIESGQICLVLTCRSDVSSTCHRRVQKYSIMKNIQTVELDVGDYYLRPNEKKNFLQKYCGRLALTKEETEELCQMKTLLGFPQCCVDFVKTKNAKERKPGSGGPAYIFLTADLITLKENDPVGYFVLLLVLMKGSIDVKKLERPTKEFKNEIEALSDICISSDNPPNCRMIKDKASHFCGIYLSKSGNEIGFQHQSIYNAVFLEIASTHLDLFLNICPAKTLVEFVRLDKSGTPRDEDRFVYVSGELYSEFTGRVIQVLLGEDGHEILDHPCFHDKRFVDFLFNKTDTETRMQIATRNIGGFSVDVDVFILGKIDDIGKKPITEICKESLMFMEKEKIFGCNHQISLMILKGLSHLATLLLFSAGASEFPVEILNEVLNSAIYINDCQIVTRLLEKGSVPSVSAIKAICCSQNTDQNVAEEIFTQITWDATFDKARILSLAVQNGNNRILSYLVEFFGKTEENMTIYAQCLKQFMFQCSNIMSSDKRTSSNAAVMDILLNTGCKFDHYTLVYLAAGHDDPQALKRLLDVPGFNLSEEQSQECLKQASFYGCYRCLEECLHNTSHRMSDQIGKCKGALLNCSARSAKESHMKMKTLIQISNGEGCGVDLADEWGNTPLHLAALKGDADCVEELVAAEADVDVENNMGISPLECAAVANSTECLKIIKKSGQTISSDRSVFKYCFHEPSRKFVYESFQAKYPELSIARKNSSNDKEIMINIGLLLKLKLSVDKRDSDGQTCVFNACHTNSPALLEYLCGKADLEIVDNKGRTVLHEAAQFGNTAMVQYLCDRHGHLKMDAQATNGETIVHAAAASHREAAEKLHYLIEEKKAPLVEDNNGRSALFPAVEIGDEEVVEYLVEKGLDLKKADSAGTTLHQVAKEHNHENLQKRVLYRRLSSRE